MGLFSENNKKVPIHINRDPNSGFDFTGAENEKHLGVAARVNRVASITQRGAIGHGLATRNNMATPKNSAPLKSSGKPLGDSNFKLKF
jgi:hypothetical protein